MFYRCPACRELEPIWQQLALDVAGDGIYVGKVRDKNIMKSRDGGIKIFTVNLDIESYLGEFICMFNVLKYIVCRLMAQNSLD